MRIAYLGLDEVNRFLARKWARKLAGGMGLIDVRRESIRHKFLGVIADAHSLPVPYRRRCLSWLSAHADDIPVLVFGHSLNDDEVADLRGRGVKSCVEPSGAAPYAAEWKARRFVRPAEETPPPTLPETGRVPLPS